MGAKKYKSPSSGIDCTAAQYITELLIGRQDKCILPAYFWRLDKYKKRYTKQIFWVNSFLKIHDEDLTIKVLLSKSGKWIYSTANPKLDELIQEEENKQKHIQETLDDTIEVKEIANKQPMKKFGKESILNKLRSLDE